MPRVTLLHSHRLYSQQRRNTMRSATCHHLTAARSGSSQDARMREKHAVRAHGIFTYQEAYAIVHGAESKFTGTCGYSSEDDTHGTDHQSVVLEPHYSRHGTDFNLATTWWRALWRNSEPHDAHFVKMHRPILKGMGRPHGGHTKATPALFKRPMTPNHAGAGCDIPTHTELHI